MSQHRKAVHRSVSEMYLGITDSAFSFLLFFNSHSSQISQISLLRLLFLARFRAFLFLLSSSFSLRLKHCSHIPTLQPIYKHYHTRTNGRSDADLPSPSFSRNLRKQKPFSTLFAHTTKLFLSSMLDRARVHILSPVAERTDPTDRDQGNPLLPCRCTTPETHTHTRRHDHSPIQTHMV